jgi:16S rRNA (guanine1516-N2)-methyltransferase
MLNSKHCRVAVQPESSQFLHQAIQISERLNLPLVSCDDKDALDTFQLLLWIGVNGVGIKKPGSKAPKPVYVDFLTGSLAYRNRSKTHSKELIVKAVGVKRDQPINVLDATAGLGRDAFILAAFGCRVHLLERSSIVFQLLQDGIKRAASHPETASVVERMQLFQLDASEFLVSLEDNLDVRPDVIYLDPMFPDRSKTAKVKKEMQVLQLLLPESADTQPLLDLAIGIAKNRVVVKRPRISPHLEGRKPGFSITGKAFRFDVYPTFNSE